MPCVRKPMIHHSDTPRLSSAIRATARTVARAASALLNADMSSHSAGAMSTNTSDDALTLPTTRLTSANSAGARQPPSCTARIVSPTSQGSAAHASRMTDNRAVNASWYGVSRYTSVPASAPIRPVPSMVKSQRAPNAAANEMEPNQSRCATQSGTPTASMSQ